MNTTQGRIQGVRWVRTTPHQLTWRNDSKTGPRAACNSVKIITFI